MADSNKLKAYVLYRDKLTQCRMDKSNEIFFNDSAIHEEFVMKELFTYASETEMGVSTMYIYCGRMSAFREDVRLLIEKTKKELEPQKGSEDMDAWKDFDPYTKMLKKMREFFDKGGRMNVIVDDEEVTSIKNEAIWRDLLSYYFEKKQLSIRRLPIKGGVNHFIVCGNAYRSELSHEDKAALCCFNDPAYAKLLYSNYSVLSKIAIPVAIA